MKSLDIIDLLVQIEDKIILEGINLKIKEGEIHVILGQNGVGKSSLCQSIMGNPRFSTKGSILLCGEEIIHLSPNERAKKGVFLAFQSPIEIDGVIISEYLKSVRTSMGHNENFITFAIELSKKLRDLGLEDKDAFRYLNTGFSGGQKKKLEILQLRMINPKFALIDEIDSGLDVDSLKIIANNILEEVKINNTGLIIVSHHHRLFEYLVPTHVHILFDKRIIYSGDASLISRVQKEGFEWLKKI